MWTVGPPPTERPDRIRVSRWLVPSPSIGPRLGYPTTPKDGAASTVPARPIGVNE